MPETKCLYQTRSDQELISLIRQNQQAAFDTLYQRYWKLLTDFAQSKLQNKQQAEDIVQEVFISLYQRRENIEVSSVRSYLYQALRFKISNEIRSVNIRKKYQEAIFFGSVSKNDFAIRAEEKELYKQIINTLNILPEKCMQVFILSRTKKLSHKDISTGLSISVSTVEKHISKALKIFRANLAEQVN